MNCVCPITVVLRGITVTFVAGSDFVGGEFTLTLSQEPNAISCVGVQILDDRLFEDVEDFVVNLRVPSDEAAIRPGPSTQAMILIDDAGMSLPEELKLLPTLASSSRALGAVTTCHQLQL